MKVLFLNYEYPPLGGGAGNATAYILREYAKIPDLEVHLVTSSVDAAFHHETIGKTVFVHRVPIGKNADTLHYQSVFDLLAFTWSGYRFSQQLLSQGGFHAVHAFFTVPCGAQAYFLGRRFGIPYIVSLRGADVPGFSERFDIFYSFLKPLIRFVWRRAFRVVAASRGLMDLAHRTDARQGMDVIPNGIAIQEFPQQKGSTDDMMRVISTSRLTPRKGLRFAIKALALLKAQKNITRIKLQLIGDGHERESLERLAREQDVIAQVEFVGRVEHNRLPEWYAQADIFILPSQNEGMSNAMLEALAAGLPLLVTDTGGTAEVLEDGKNGLLLKQQSAQDIADKIERLYVDVALRKRMASASREKAETMSWENIARQYAAVYFRMIE